MCLNLGSHIRVSFLVGLVIRSLWKSRRDIDYLRCLTFLRCGARGTVELPFLRRGSSIARRRRRRSSLCTPAAAIVSGAGWTWRLAIIGLGWTWRLTIFDAGWIWIPWSRWRWRRAWKLDVLLIP